MLARSAGDHLFATAVRVRTLPDERRDTTTVCMMRGRWQQVLMWFGPPLAADGSSVDAIVASVEVTHEIVESPSRPN